MRRLVAAAESASIGYGGVSVVARATGVSRRAITGRDEEAESAEGVGGASSLRSPEFGGKVWDENEPSTRIPASVRTWTDWWIPCDWRRSGIAPLRWTCKSVRVLAEELRRQGHAVSHRKPWPSCFTRMDYSLQANQKKLEGSQHADRNQQFEYINRKAIKRYLKQGEPVTRKRRNCGRDFKNPGRQWQPQGQPEPVRVHDFEIRSARRTVRWFPMGSMTLAGTRGGSAWGVDHDTAEFAVESIRRWWRWMGRLCYPESHPTVDHG